MSRHLPHDWYDRPLPDNARLGEGSWLYSSFAFRHWQARHPRALTVGRHCGLYNGTFFDLGPDGRLSLGDYSALVGVIVCSNAEVRIGSYVFMAHEVVLADRAAAVPGEATADGAGIRVDDLAWVGARAILLGGARIGRGAVVGAGAVVDFEVPPGAVVAGNPGRVMRVDAGGARE